MVLAYPKTIIVYSLIYISKDNKDWVYALFERSQIVPEGILR